MSDIDSRIKELRKKLRSSSTAVSSGAKPTSADIKNEKALREAEAKKSSELGDKVKKNNGSKEKKKESTIGRVLNFLNAPVALGAGAVETALGQGTKEGLLENMRENVREGGTYGDVLRQSGASNWVAAPIGFVLDVALDPVNWATAGTTAMVPRIAKGIGKKGLHGAKVATKMAASEKIDGMLAATSASYRKFQYDGTPIPGKLGKIMEGIVTNAKKNSEVYDQIVEGGSSALERLTKENQTYTDKFISKMGEAINNVKPGTTKWLRKHFYGDEKKWLDESKLAEDIRNSPDGPDVAKAIKAKEKKEVISGLDEAYVGDGVPTSAKEGDLAVRGKVKARYEESQDLAIAKVNQMALDMEDNLAFQAKLERVIERYFDEGSEHAKKLRNLGADDEKLIKKMGKKMGKDADTKKVIEAAKREAQEDFLATLTSLKSDVQGYDSAVAKILLNGTAQKFFKGHSRLMGAFKASVIGLSVPARVNQAIGNFVAFVPISGINPFNTGFTKSLIRAAKFSYTQDIKYLGEMLTNKQMMLMLERYPDTFTKITGVKAEFLIEGPKYIERRARELAARGLKKEADAMMEYVSGFEESLQKTVGKEVGKEIGEAAGKAAAKAAKREAVKPFQTKGMEFGTKEGSINLMQEFNIGQVAKWKKELLEKAQKGDKIAKMTHFLIDAPLEDYGRGDQIFKLGMMMHTTKNGISEAEMNILKKWYKFKPGDISQSKNGLRYKLSPEASMDVASSLFLNYSAMPTWSKIARSLPFIGAPFASFAAGAQKNVLKGIGYNLSYFNKVRNVIHEVSGEKGPLEREALDSGYYDHITSNPAMVKLPFFKENPLYLNLGNALHVFDSNLLDSPERDYESKYGKEFVKLIDKSPFVKDPTGQFMLNYLVLPYLLGQAIGPFNNELYSEDASLGEKVGKTAVGAVEPFMPKTPGMALAGLPVPEEGIPYIPSYDARALKNALRGKGPTGSNSSESPESKTGRTLSRGVGLPIYKVNTNTSKKK